MGFLKFLLIVFIIFYVLMLLGRYFLKRFIARNSSQFSNAQTHNTKYKKMREGETFVEYKPQEKKQIPDDEGDYVDYEEVK